MRVLHLLKTSHGASWALRQVKELVASGVEVHVALPADGPLLPSYAAAGATVHTGQFDLPVRRPWLLATRAAALRALVGRVQPDIIHSHFVGTTLTARVALGPRHPVPRVFQVPGPLHLEHSFFRRAELALAGPADYWIGSCRWTCAAYMRSGVAPQRIGLAYYGIEVDQFSPAEPGALRRELGLADGTQIVGMVAYMYAPKRYLGQRRGLKGHEDLVDALAMLRTEGRSVVGVFAGGAWAGADRYERAVRRYAFERCGSAAMFLGTRHEVAQIYADFDVVAHPSHSENLGGALESLALAVPTVATRVGGFPDVVEAGKTGWLVPPRDPTALAAALAEALDAPATSREMAARGQELVRRRFCVRATAEQVLRHYEALLARGRFDEITPGEAS